MAYIAYQCIEGTRLDVSGLHDPRQAKKLVAANKKDSPRGGGGRAGGKGPAETKGLQKLFYFLKKRL